MGQGLPGPPGGACRVGSGLGGGHHQRQDEADAALAILRAEIPDYDRRVAGGEVARVGAAGHHGGDRRPEQGNNVTLAKSNRGTSKTYLISRLKRDAADPACPGRTQARHWLKRLEADLARRQTDPASPEFVKPEGAKGIGKRGSNTTALSNKERHSKPGTLRRLARSHPDLLARVESGELSANAAAVQAGIRKPMRSIPVDTPDAAIRALLRVKARLRCEDPACGIAGPNPDARFGKWVCTNFMQTHRNTILNARRLWEVFGQRQEEQADSLLTTEGRDGADSEGWGGARVG